MKSVNRSIAALVCIAAIAIVGVWGLNQVALAVVTRFVSSDNELAMWQPRTLFTSFAVVEIVFCLVLEVLAIRKRKRK